MAKNSRFTIKSVAQGCITALLAAAVLISLVVALYLRTESGQQTLQVVHEGKSFYDGMRDATHAPGTTELRALGCIEAAVIDYSLVENFGSSLVDAGPIAPTTSMRLIVSCASDATTPPTCQDVATTYIHTVKRAIGTFATAVARSNKSLICSQLFDANGVLLGNTPMDGGVIAPPP